METNFNKDDGFPNQQLTDVCINIDIMFYSSGGNVTSEVHCAPNNQYIRITITKNIYNDNSIIYNEILKYINNNNSLYITNIIESEYIIDIYVYSINYLKNIKI